MLMMKMRTDCVCKAAYVCVCVPHGMHGAKQLACACVCFCSNGSKCGNKTLLAQQLVGQRRQQQQTQTETGTKKIGNWLLLYHTQPLNTRKAPSGIA